MNDKFPHKTPYKKPVHTAKECAYIAVFTALVIAAQLALSAVPGVEIVTVLFVSYSYTFGWKRGMAAATAFALLRQIVFGVYPVVLVVYLIYYNGLAAAFGRLGKTEKTPAERLALVTVTACVCTVCFTLLDSVLTPLFYQFTWKATKTYFLASLSFMLPQTLSAGLSVGLLFLPLVKAFRIVKRAL